MTFLLKWKCSLVSQNDSGPHHALLVSDIAFPISHFLFVHVSVSADGDHIHGTAVVDFAAASISHCLEIDQASAVHFWWISKRKVEYQQHPSFGFQQVGKVGRLKTGSWPLCLVSVTQILEFCVVYRLML